MSADTTAPALFISHGAPAFALAPGAVGARLAALGRRLPHLRGVLVLSPHWMTRGVRVMAAAQPATLHDFGGFPEPLYRLDYPAPGSPALAMEACRLLTAAGFAAEPDPVRGRDHGAWVPLLHLLPEPRLPVIQVSMPADLDPAGAWRMGQALAPLRAQGVLLVGSGSLTHNIYEVGAHAEDTAYVSRFAEWIRTVLAARDLPRLLDYRRLAPAATRAHPTEEHFLPLPFAFGASAPEEPMQHLPGGVSYGILAMDAFAWGAPCAPT